MRKISLVLTLTLIITFLAGCSGRQVVEPPLQIFPAITADTPTSATSVNYLPRASEIEAGDPLPVFDSFESLLARIEEGGGYGYGFHPDEVVVFEAEPGMDMVPSSPQNDMTAARSDGGAAAASGAAGDFSETNTQKEGVDEGDIIKTDGSFIYTLNGNSVAIVGVDGAEMEQQSAIQVDGGLHVEEFYVVGDRLVIAGSLSREFPLPRLPDGGSRNRPSPWWPDTFSKPYTAYHIYDITDRQEPALLQEFEVSGSSLATRVIGGALYYVTTQYPPHSIPWAQYRDNGIDILEEWLLPAWGNSTDESGERFVPAETIRYFPDSSESNFMLVGVLELTGNGTSEPQAYFGGGETFYMDTEYMAIACHVWRGGWSRSAETRVYRFALGSDGVVYTGNAVVDGQVIDQYAMDVHDGNLRIAASNTRGNTVSVFDRGMKLVGATEPFAVTESVRSVRFMGDMVYVVTFEVVDPLFCIDLSDPANPVILGELKIPGFSQYLHPVGGGLLVGFGRETRENEWGWFDDIGFKISLFDVNDPRDPQELAMLFYSDEEFYSDTFTNPRSILVDRGRQRFAFAAIGVDGDGFDPVIPDNDIDAYMQDYYPDVWYGVIVVDVLDGGLEEAQVIKHGILTYEDYEKGVYGDMFYHNPMAQFTVRAVYIGDVLYTAGNGRMSAYDYEGFNLLGTIELS